MNAKAIVYTSNTGYTAAYARMLAESSGLPAYSLTEASSSLAAGTPIIYMGWLMAGSVKDYRKAAKRYAICALCGVGLGDTGAQDAAVRKAHALPQDLPTFTLQGGMDLQRLKGPYRFAIRMLTKGLTASKKRTPAEDRMLQLLRQGGDYVSMDNLSAVLAWMNS